MDSVRVAIVGLGIFGETHVATLKTLPQVDLVAVCDLREDRAAAMAAQYGIPRHFTDCTDLLNAVPVDVIAVVTPEDNHLGPSLAAMEAGKAVFMWHSSGRAQSRPLRPCGLSRRGRPPGWIPE